jgi:CRP/FNR family cyclic AMP-dependent transcriptional regulator
MDGMAVVGGLDASDRNRLLDRSVERRLEPGDILHLAGHRSDRIHLIVEGVVKLSLRDSEGEETILGLAPAGTIVGDVAAVDGRPQPLDAVAATPVVACGVDADLFVDIVFADPSAARELSRLQAARTRWVIETALERTSGEVTARLAGRLLDLGQMLGTSFGKQITVDLPLSQRDLGKLAGMCRESTCKTLRRLKAAGVVDYQGRKLRILRPDSLRKMRCGMGD